MISFCVSLDNMLDADFDPHVFGPYSVDDESDRDEWLAHLEQALADLSEELFAPYVDPRRILMRCDSHASEITAATPPAIGFLMENVRQLWQDNLLGLARKPVAA